MGELQLDITSWHRPCSSVPGSRQLCSQEQFYHARTTTLFADFTPANFFIFPWLAVESIYEGGRFADGEAVKQIAAKTMKEEISQNEFQQCSEQLYIILTAVEIILRENRFVNFYFVQ